MNKPLSGLRVLDLSQFLSASFCTMLLAGMGAEVVKLERPGTGDPARLSPPFGGAAGVGITSTGPEDLSLAILKRGRNKKSITLNLHSEKGKELFIKLLSRFDVLVENFRPGTMEKLGLSYETLKEHCPGLIYASISGFGDVKAYEKLPAFDIVIQAMSGLMSTNGSMDGPPTKTSAAISDLSAGLFLCSGILAALHRRQITGEGDKVSVSLMDSVISLMLDEAPDVWGANGYPERCGSRLTRLTPFNSYTAKDGGFVIASGGDKHWAEIAKAMGKPEYIDDPRFAHQSARAENAELVDSTINEWGSKLTVAEVLTALRAGGVPCGEVRSVKDMLADNELADAGVIGPVIHPTAGALSGASVGHMPIRFENAVSDFDSAAPFLGQHNAEVYCQMLGLSPEELCKLNVDKVV